MQGSQSPESSAAEILSISSAGMCKWTMKSGARSPSLKTSAAGGKTQPVGPRQVQEGSRTGTQTERRRPRQQPPAGGCARAGGARRAVAAGGAGPGCGRGRAASGGRGLHEARPLPYAGGLPARCTSASRASASSLAPSRPPPAAPAELTPPPPVSHEY